MAFGDPIPALARINDRERRDPTDGSVIGPGPGVLPCRGGSGFDGRRLDRARGDVVTVQVRRSELVCDHCGSSETIPPGLTRNGIDEETVRVAFAARWTFVGRRDLCPVCSRVV